MILSYRLQPAVCRSAFRRLHRLKVVLNLPAEAGTTNCRLKAELQTAERQTTDATPRRKACSTAATGGSATWAPRGCPPARVRLRPPRGSELFPCRPVHR